MASELVGSLKKFSLSEQENKGIILEEVDVALNLGESHRSLFGKIHGIKKVSFMGLRNTLQSLWVTKAQFVIRELGVNRYQFVFQNDEDLEKVFNSKVWTFDSQYILLKKWSEGMVIENEVFEEVNLWLQAWNIPNHWISTETGLKVGKLFANTRDILIPESGSSKGRVIKLLVSVNLNKPLLRGINLKLGEISLWVDFKYENLMGLCFYCGYIGHFERACETRKNDLLKGRFCEGQFGEWLRAEEWHNIAKKHSNSTGNKAEAPLRHVNASEPQDAKQKENPGPSNLTDPLPETRSLGTQGEKEIIRISEEDRSCPMEEELTNPPECPLLFIEAGNLVSIPLKEVKSRAPLADIYQNIANSQGSKRGRGNRGRGRGQKSRAVVPRVPGMKENKEGNEWNQELIAEVFPSHDVSAITSTPIHFQWDRDRILWNLTQDHLFTVKSAYKACCEEERLLRDAAEGSRDCRRAKICWDRLWKLKVKGKVKLFLWKCLKDVVLVQAKLIERGMSVDPVCKWCGENEETLEHLLFFCDRTVNVWKFFPLQWNGIHSRFERFRQWWEEVCSCPWDQAFQDRIQLTTYLLWWLWKTWNSWVFEDKTTPDSETASLAWKEWNEFDSLN
ncbi:hypothetical protein DH2020_000261 [Rehmannia glutinosa]|uniref:CCHC-type domain-containing protein n=1 Tax=Rehmannia glutinosa TaxID=99300 RepID=A0ABR0XW58_REHGL